MSEEVKRSYHSPLRADTARRTRATIRDAAAGLFAAEGYVNTTIRQIAQAAGVAQRTVFTAYPGGKAELFHDALNVAVAGDDLPVAQADRPEFHDDLADPARLVDAVASRSADLLERAGRLIMTTVESAGADPDMRRLADEGAKATASNMRTVAHALAAHNLLRPDITPSHAADVLFALCSPHMHSLLRHQRRWSKVRYRDWLATTIRATLLARTDH